jgi:Xaa-Pro aminopeptidase
MKIYLFIIFILSLFQQTFAQKDNPYRYEKDFLSADFYKGRRAELRKQLPGNSVAFLFSAPVKNISNDVDYPFHQHPHFYYLTGFTQPNSVLIIYTSQQDVAGIKTNEILFIPERDADSETWTGRMADSIDARKISGVNTVLLTSAFESIKINPDSFSKILYLPLPMIDKKNDSLDLYNLVEIFKTKINYPPSNGDSFILNKTLAGLRELKQPEEMVLMRKSISMSCEGHMEMMRALQPGMSEYQVQAVGEYVFKIRGAENTGYPSICGGSENSTVLHYESNRKTLAAGDLILLDMGAEYHGYSADVTRTLPVSGKFTNEQKIIYELVLKAQDSAFSKCKPGNEFKDPHRAAVSVIKEGLKELGIISDPEEYRNYFMHGTSHYLGLDVHDLGSYGMLKEGSVLTVEPGIYISSGSKCDPKWWNIGIRIEDDVLITSEGYENLSIQCPSSVAEVEKMMNEAPLFIISKK